MSFGSLALSFVALYEVGGLKLKSESLVTLLGLRSLCQVKGLTKLKV